MLNELQKAEVRRAIENEMIGLAKGLKDELFAEFERTLQGELGSLRESLAQTLEERDTAQRELHETKSKLIQAEAECARLRLLLPLDREMKILRRLHAGSWLKATGNGKHEPKNPSHEMDLLEGGQYLKRLEAGMKK